MPDVTGTSLDARFAAADNNPPAANAGATAADASQTVTKDAFLKLLVAQIKNQDPLNPADSVQFLTQLAQFSQLEQTMGIRSDIQALTQVLEKAAPASTQPSHGTTP